MTGTCTSCGITCQCVHVEPHQDDERVQTCARCDLSRPPGTVRCPVCERQAVPSATPAAAFEEYRAMVPSGGPICAPSATPEPERVHKALPYPRHGHTACGLRHVRMVFPPGDIDCPRCLE